MADLILETGAGVASSNSYISLDNADIYHEMRLHVSTWTDANDDTKEAALMWATRLLDNLVDWEGTLTTEGQSLRWPRENVYDIDGYEIAKTIIPDFLSNATAEYARNLIDADPTGDSDLAGFKKLKIDVLELEVDKWSESSSVPKSVWDMVKQYGQKYANSQRLLARV